MRFNHLQPPFDNPAIRRAVIGAITQSDYMMALNGPDKSLWRDDVGYFAPGSPLANDAGMDRLMGKRDLAKVRKDIGAAGYKGEKVAMLVAVDVPYLKIMGEVNADVFKKIGLNVDYQAVDWSTVSQRRAKTDPPEAGGWSVYSIYDNGSNQVNPASHVWLRGTGKSAGFGWPTSPKPRRFATLGFRPKPSTNRRRLPPISSCRPLKTCPTFRWGSQYPLPVIAAISQACSMANRCSWNIKRQA